MKRYRTKLLAACAAVMLALTGCTVSQEEIAKVRLVDSSGAELASVSEMNLGESRSFTLEGVPDGVEVNVVSSDRQLLQAEYTDGQVEITALGGGSAILTLELSLEENSLSKSYEIQIASRKLQVGMNLIDSRPITGAGGPEAAFRPESESIGAATFAQGYLELQAGNQATLLFTGFDITGGEPVPAEGAISVRAADTEVTFDGTYYLSGDRIILQCPRAGQYTLDLIVSCEGYTDTEVQLQIGVSEPGQSITLSAKGFDAYLPTIEVGSSVIIDVGTVSDETQLSVEADGSIVTAAVSDGRLTITAIQEGIGSVTLRAVTPGYKDAELSIQAKSVPELIPLTVLGDELERNNVVHMTVGQLVELTILNPDEGDLSHEVENPEILTAIQKGSKLELEALAPGESDVTLTCSRNGYSTNTKTVTVIVSEETE